MTEYCPRCDDYLDDDRVRADDALVCLDCTDEEERGELLLKAEAEIAAKDAEIERLRAVLREASQYIDDHGAGGTPDMTALTIGMLKTIDVALEQRALEQSADTTQKS